MRYLPDFDAIDSSTTEPLVIHRHGDKPGHSLLILIHGLGGSRYGTWTFEGTEPHTASLPKFLYEDVAGLDVGLYQYDTAVRRLRAPKSLELEQEAETLANRLRDQVQTSYASVVVAGHSMGGILARAAVRELIQRNDEATLKAIKGLFLLASPQAGSLRVPSWLGFLTPDTRALRPHGPLVTQIQQVFTNRIVAERHHLQPGQYFIPTFVVAGDYDKWVDRFSAGLNVPSARMWTVRSTHTGAVKPQRRDDDEYTWVRDRVRDLVAAAAEASGDPFDACDLQGKLFINRAPLRQALRDMVSASGSTRVLGVKGPPRSGKTHSIYLIEHAEQKGVYEKALVQLERNQSPVTMSPALLAQSVIDLIGGDADRVSEPPGGVTEARWLGRTADYIVGQIKAKDSPVLVVLDGFADPNLPTPTRQLIQEIVKRADREPRLRVVLLDYSEDLLTPDIAGRLATEPISTFTEDDLRRFFSAYAGKYGLRPPSAAELTAVVSATFDALQPDERSRNDRISFVVQTWVSRVKAAPADAWTTDTVAAIREAGRTPAAAAGGSDEQFHDAAAVVSSFVLDRVRHTGAAGERLEADSVRIMVDGSERRVLTNEARKRTLRRLNTVAAIRGALSLAPDRPTDVVQQTIDGWLDGRPIPVEQQNGPQLSATLQVIEWFAETELRDRLPSAESVRTRVEWESLLQPLRALTGTSFRGRALELAALEAYVGSRPDNPSGARPPLLVFGPGGMGKSTLLARFVLDHARVLPFVYLDSDRPGLSAEEPLTLLAEAVRQLGLQFPAYRTSAELLRSRWLSRVTDSYTTRSEAGRRTLGRADSLEEFGIFARQDLGLRDRSLLVVLDTFEEVQYRSTAAVEEVFAFLGELQEQLPGVRTVIAGRNQALELDAEPMEITELDDESAQSLLESLGVPSADVREKLARLLHGNPLSLRLAAEVVRRNQDALTSIEQLSDDTQIQGVLYNRVLGHIHEKDVLRLAHPGLILRRITPDIIQHVLAEPCGLGPVDQARAEALWSLLEKELALVTREGDALRHRSDVRRVMLAALKKDRVETVRKVHEAAVAYYARFDDTVSRAEELYHRLSLGQQLDALASRWLPGIEASLATALDELDDHARRQLATRLQIELADDDWQSFEQPEWEAYVAKRVEDLLRLDRPLDAVRILRRRSTRLPGSQLDWLHSRALFRIGHRLEAFELAQHVIGAALNDRMWADNRRSSGMQWMLDELLEWFVNPALTTMPTAVAIRRRVEWLDQLHPLRVLADRLFVGRERELAFLDSYVFNPQPSEGPLVVHGVGGAGKSSLVAKYTLDRIDDVATAYVDAALLDLPIYTVIDPVLKILNEMVRQLMLQTRDETPRAAPDDRDAALAAIEALSTPGTPLLLVIDNVDLLQHRTRPLVFDLVSAFNQLAGRVPSCRPVLISRNDLEGFPHLTLAVGRLDTEATHAYLAAEQIAPQIRDRIAQLADGNALAMRLAAAVVRREGAEALNQLSLNESSIAATLLERIFSRIHDPRVRVIARAGLLVQRITPEIVRLVLAPAAGVNADDEPTANELFELLSREPALFAAAEHGIRPRGDVQRLAAPGLAHEQPELMRRVHERAISYYSSQRYSSMQDEVAARVQEVYHRLMAGQGANEIDPRWIPGVDVGLRGLVGDLTGAARAYLAARLGLDLPEIDWSAADQPTWERHAAMRAQELIALKRFTDAIDVLRERSTRLSRSPLLALEAESLLRSGDPRGALDVVRRGLSLWPDDPALPALRVECEALLGAAASQPATPPPAVTVTDAPTLQLREGVVAVDVAIALGDVLKTTSDVMLLARQIGLRDYASAPVSSGPPNVLHLVQQAERDGLLNALVSAAAASFGTLPQFAWFVKQSTIRVGGSAADPIAAVRLGTSALMFGRFGLRDFLRGVVSERPRFRVLLVDGPPGSGKTHTSHLVAHVARATSRYRMLLQNYDSPGLSLSDYVMQLYRMVDWKWEPPDTSQLSTDAFVRVLAEQFRARALAEPQSLVLMFEVGPRAVPAVTAFVEALAANPGRLSMIVTGVDEERLRAAGAPLMVEHLATLSREEVEDGMRQVARELNLDHALVTEWVRHTFAAQPVDAPVNARVTREMRRLLDSAIERAAGQD